jgi:Glycosyl hydrolases family 16
MATYRLNRVRRIVLGLLVAPALSGFMAGQAFAQRVVPYGVSAPSGTTWVMTFDDEFTQDASIDESKWNGGASNTAWCDQTDFYFHNTGRIGNNGGNYIFIEPYNNPCIDNLSGLRLSRTNGLEFRSPPYYTDQNGIFRGGPSAAIQTGGRTVGAAKFAQTYGYFEASIKKSSLVGDHFDFWVHPVPGLALPEINIGEEPSWNAGQDAAQTYANFGFADVNAGYGGVINTGVNLSSDFHTYGMWWNYDGSGPFGSVSFYFDGQLVQGPFTVSSQDTNMANGVYMLLSLDGVDLDGNPRYPNWINNPTSVRYVRVWRLAPN